MSLPPMDKPVTFVETDRAVAHTEAYFRELAYKVAAEYGCGVQYIELQYARLDDEWGWTCIVREKYKKVGRGKRLVRPPGYFWGATLEEAVKLALERAAVYKTEDP